MFMNEHEIDYALERFAEHPVLGPATQTLSNLRHAVNANSDGWPYWNSPARAAGKLMELIQGDGTTRYQVGPREDATAERLRVALRPIKAFRTKHKIQFEIVGGK